MPLEAIKCYDIAITGDLRIVAKNDTQAIKDAKEYILAHVDKLNFATTETDSFEHVETPTP